MWRNENNNNENGDSATTNLLYRPLSTRRIGTCCFGLSKIINDIADFLYWLQELYLPMHLRCIYYVVAKNLICVCIEDEDHIHPFQAHHRLMAITYGCVLINYHFWYTIIKSGPSMRGDHESQWGERLSLVPFNNIK
jgi:hypothetical protein